MLLILQITDNEKTAFSLILQYCKLQSIKTESWLSKCKNMFLVRKKRHLQKQKTITQMHSHFPHPQKSPLPEETEGKQQNECLSQEVNHEARQGGGWVRGAAVWLQWHSWWVSSLDSGIACKHRISFWVSLGKENTLPVYYICQTKRFIYL